MAENNQMRATGSKTAAAWFRGAFGITLGVILALVLVVGVLTVLFV